jgi:hypothetical protein
MRQGHSWIPVVAILVGPLIIWIAHRFQQVKIQAQRDVQLALLGKFSSGEEMTRFLASEEGKRLIDRLATPGEDDPRQKTAGMLIAASILTMLAIAFAGLAVASGERHLAIPAVVIGSVGIGLFIGAGISHRFSKETGLIQERS